MKGLNKSEKVLITVLLVMLVGYVYYQYVITPVFTKIKAAQSNIENYDQQLRQFKLMEASNKKMTADMEALKTNYDKYVNKMPKSDMSAEIIREVNTLALDNKVTLNSLTLADGAEYNSPADAAKGSATVNNNAAAAQKTEAKTSSVKVMAVPVSINIKGDYSSFTAFINSLESGGRITNINSVNVAKQEKENAGDKLTVTLNASVLYLQDGTEAQNKYEFNNGKYSKSDPFR